jgi:2-octaprenyl-6-methoxyphenol hydroxylase
MDDTALSTLIERQAHSHLGAMQVEGRRHVFPLAFEQPRQLAARRVILIGEAAHVFPPIGAQGLNLGFRDAAVAARTVIDALEQKLDPGADAILNLYERQRRPDIVRRSSVINLANLTLLSSFLPAQAVRSAGMHLLNSVRPLRHLAMRQALTQTSDSPDHSGTPPAL